MIKHLFNNQPSKGSDMIFVGIFPDKTLNPTIWQNMWILLSLEIVQFDGSPRSLATHSLLTQSSCHPFWITHTFPNLGGGCNLVLSSIQGMYQTSFNQIGQWDCLLIIINFLLGNIVSVFTKDSRQFLALCSFWYNSENAWAYQYPSCLDYRYHYPRFL